MTPAALLALHGAVQLAASSGAAHPATAHAATAQIATPSIRYLAILPEIVMLGGAVLLLGVASLVARPLRVTVATSATVVVCVASLAVSLWQWADVTPHGAFTAVDHAVVVDGFSVLINILVSSAMLLTALVGDGYLRREGVDGPEFHVLAMVSSSGAMIMASAGDLIVIFLGLEILSIALYVLAAFNHRRAASGEAALKYFILGSFSSAVFIYGVALVYGATGSTNLAQVADFLSRNVILSDGLLLAGLTLLLVGFGFKVAAVPFHMWTPDVYQGAPSPVTGFMAAVSKAGAFAALLRVFISSLGVYRADWQPIVYGLAVVTLLVGAGLAVVQRDVKRMLAYSSVNHAGFVLLGLYAATTQGVSAALYYLFAYTFMVIGSFAVVTVLGRRGDAAHDIASYRGLAGRQPLLALCFAVLLLAQAGAPFTTGLWAKLQVVQAAVDANGVPLAAIAMVSAALAAFFYLRVAVLMYSPLPDAGAQPGVEAAAEALVPLTMGTVAPAALAASGEAAPLEAHHAPAGEVGAGPGAGPRPVWAGAERQVAVTSGLNAGLLLDADPLTAALGGGGAGPQEGPEAGDGFAGTAGAERMLLGGPEGPEWGATVEGRRAGGATAAVEVTSVLAAGPVRVPALAALAIGLCTAVSVVFGLWPAPLTDFAHHATLLFTP